MTYDTRRFWDRVGQIRGERDASVRFDVARTEAIERAVAELVDEACSPWFDDRAFVREEREFYYGGRS